MSGRSGGSRTGGTRVRGAAATASTGSEASTASRVLDAAEALVQTRGFNGFSYADIAAELQITKASLHYHFATKADLGEALIIRYAARFLGALAGLDTDGAAAPAKLTGYAGLYADVLSERKMCLCGMLAAEYPTLPCSSTACSQASFWSKNASTAVCMGAGRVGYSAASMPHRHILRSLSTSA